MWPCEVVPWALVVLGVVVCSELREFSRPNRVEITNRLRDDQLYPDPVMTELVVEFNFEVFTLRFACLRCQWALLSCLLELFSQFDTSDGSGRTAKSSGKVTVRKL